MPLEMKASGLPLLRSKLKNPDVYHLNPLKGVSKIPLGGFGINLWYEFFLHRIADRAIFRWVVNGNISADVTNIIFYVAGRLVFHDLP